MIVEPCKGCFQNELGCTVRVHDWRKPMLFKCRCCNDGCDNELHCQNRKHLSACVPVKFRKLFGKNEHPQSNWKIISFQLFSGKDREKQLLKRISPPALRMKPWRTLISVISLSSLDPHHFFQHFLAVPIRMFPKIVGFPPKSSIKK